VLEADLATFRSKILRILTDCAIKMPEKCTIYTTLVGLLNAKNYNFGGEVRKTLLLTTDILICYERPPLNCHI
jgi:hypothetical protein